MRAAAPDVALALQFDELPPTRFPPQRLPDGSYRAALEVFQGDVLVAQIDLGKFTISNQGQSLAREGPKDSSLTVIQP
jgi:hypothetical protein